MSSLRKIILGLAMSLCITAPALAGVPVTLKTNAFAEGPVTLGDIFDGAGRAAGVVIAPAPVSGGSVMIEAATAQRLALANGLSWSNENGIRRVIVRAGASSAAEAAAQRPAAKGVEVLTWARSIETGEVIAAEDLTWSTLPAQPAGAARDADVLIGKVAKRPLRAGAPAATRDAGAPQVIKKDDMVTVAYATGGISLSLQAKALGPAAAGDTLTLINLNSKKTIQALAVGPGQAIVGPQADLLRAQSLALR